MAELLGRRRMFMLGLVVFSLASLAGGLAQSETWLIAARAVQGLGAAIVSPAALSITTTTFADGAERNRALGIWGAVAGAGGAAGVLLGGILTSGLSWRWVLEPITVNVHNANADNSMGSLIATDTQTFEIPYRPSADPTDCPNSGTTNGTQWFDGVKCDNGLATNVGWDLSSATLTLPSKVIVSLAYNTSDYGYQPYGDSTPCHATSAGCPYDSLNVAVTAPPSVGSDPTPDGAYLNSTTADSYGDGGAGGTGIFRYDPTGWTGYQPAIEVSTTG